MTYTTTVLVTLIVYKLVLVAIGLAYRAKTRDSAEFFLGGRQLGPVMAAISSAASSSSGWTLLGVSGYAYVHGLSALWLFPACVGGFLINWFLVAPGLQRLSRRQASITTTEVLVGGHSGKLASAISWLATLIVIVSFVTYIAAQFQAAGKSFEFNFKIGFEESVLVGAAIILIYTLLGGFMAVSVTDTLQGLLMALTAVTLPVAALIHVGGVWALADKLALLPDAESFLSLSAGQSPAVAIGFIFGLLGIGLGYPGQPHVVNRFMAMADDKKVVRSARRIALSWAVLVYAGMILLGICGKVIVKSLDDNEAVLLELNEMLFHPVIAGIMVASVLSAIMSTADSQFLVAASSITHDLGLGGPTQQSLVRRSRFVIVLLCALAVGSALLGTKAIFDKVLFAWSAMGAAFGPLLLVTIWRGRVSALGTLLAMGLGFTLSVTFFVLRQKAVFGELSFFKAWGTSLERVLPFAVATVIALLFVERNKGHEPAQPG